MTPAVSDSLTEQGYRVLTGTLGPVVKLSESTSRWLQIEPVELPPGYQEAGVVVINLEKAPRDSSPETRGEDVPGNWMKCDRGIIDHRFATVQHVTMRPFLEMWVAGTIFIFFTGPSASFETATGAHERFGLQFQSNPEKNCLHEMFLLPLLPDIHLNHASSNTIKGYSSDPIAQVLKRYWTETSLISAVISPHRESTAHTIRGLAHDKFDRPVACISPPDEHGRGHVIVLPQVEDSSSFLADLLEEALPALAPILFESSDHKWAHDSSYELPDVVALTAQIGSIRIQAEVEIAALNERIHAVRNDRGFEHVLIQGTGDELVDAVRRALEELGFRDVIDADHELRDGRQLREDLRVEAHDGIWMIEVKGVAGHPAEADSLQITKYQIGMMKERNRTDVRSVTIVNHFRTLPPLERNNDDVFGAVVLARAEHDDLSLLTTWDLLRLIRGYREWNWNHDAAIRPLFRINGRINALPAHYQLIGIIRKVWDRAGVLSIELTSDLQSGQQVGFEPRPWFREVVAESLQVNKQPVERAVAGMFVGLKVDRVTSFREGQQVYRANRPLPPIAGS